MLLKVKNKMLAILEGKYDKLPTFLFNFDCTGDSINKGVTAHLFIITPQIAKYGIETFFVVKINVKSFLYVTLLIYVCTEMQCIG